MEESVALDSSKQNNFVKSVRSIKKRLKKKDQKPEEAAVVNKEDEKKEGDDVVKKNKIKRRKKRGLVYLSHIPHGFYEKEMTEYFRQFGVVTNARVIRSRRTGNSKGFAFVEFREPEVAEVVAETMNNYLMGKRLIKAAYIPPNKQRVNALRKNWNPQNNPSSNDRQMRRKKHNAVKNNKQELKLAKGLISTLLKTKKKLNDLGIDYDFFKPVDVPEVLVDAVNALDTKTDVKSNKEVKNESKTLKSEITSKSIKSEPEDVNVIEKTDKKKNKKLKKQAEKEKSDSDETSKKKASKSDNSKTTVEIKQNNIEGNNKIKQNKQQKASIVKKEENFITIKQSSDSECSFDSDEFEKMIQMENSDLTSGDDSNESEEEEILELPTMKKKKTKPQKLEKAESEPKAPKKKDKGSVTTQSVVKRKTAQSAPLVAKKAKFEKQLGDRKLNKIKKRK